MIFQKSNKDLCSCKQSTMKKTIRVSRFIVLIFVLYVVAILSPIILLDSFQKNPETLLGMLVRLVTGLPVLYLLLRAVRKTILPKQTPTAKEIEMFQKNEGHSETKHVRIGWVRFVASSWAHS